MADSSGIRAGRAYVELGTSDKLAAGLKKARAQLAAFSAAVTGIGRRMSVLGLGALSGMGLAAKAFAEAGGALMDMSGRTGMSVEALSELQFAAKQSGVEMEALEGSVRKMQKNIAEAATGSGSAAKAFSDLGLSAAALLAMSPDQQLEAIADRLGGIQNPAQRAAAAMEIFGKSGAGLLPLMQDGAGGIAALRKQARALGLTMSTEDAKAADELDDSLAALWMTGKRLYTTIGSALAPVLTSTAKAITGIVSSSMAWLRQNRGLVVAAAGVAAAIAAAGVALLGLGTVAGIAATVLGAIGTTLGILLSPIGLVVGAVAGAGFALLKFTNGGSKALKWLKTNFGQLYDGAKDVLKNIGDALESGQLDLAAKVAWAGLRVAWHEGIIDLKTAWSEFGTWMQKTFVTTAFAISDTWRKATEGIRREGNWVTWQFGHAKADYAYGTEMERIEQMPPGPERERARVKAGADRHDAIYAADMGYVGQLHQITNDSEKKQKELEAQLVKDLADIQSNQGLLDAQNALEKAKDEIAKAKQQANPGGNPWNQGGPDLDGINNALGGAMRRIAVSGTFSGAGAQGLGAGSQTLEKIHQVGQRQLGFLQEIAKAARVPLSFI